MLLGKKQPLMSRKISMLTGSYKIGSVRHFFLPSFRLSVRFPGIGSLVFSETQHGVRGPYIVVCDRAGFFRKNSHRPKMVKNSSKTCFLDFLKKSCHQFCLEFAEDESSYVSLTFCENCMLVENLVLKLQAKMYLGQRDFSIL